MLGKSPGGNLASLFSRLDPVGLAHHTFHLLTGNTDLVTTKIVELPERMFAKADRLHYRSLPWHGLLNQDPLEPVAVQTCDEGLATAFKDIGKESQDLRIHITPTIPPGFKALS